MSDVDELSEDGEPDQGRARVRKSPNAFRTISEVADELHIPQHVLRFWETKFPQVKPLKRGGGRRYYRPDDLALLKRISDLLYIQGYTIKGVQRLLREGPGPLGEDAALSDEAEDGVGEVLEGEIDLSQVSDEELFRLMRESKQSAPAEPPAPAPEPRDGEAERLRAALREALSALEALRAMLA